jgi:hypothetical protein
MNGISLVGVTSSRGKGAIADGAGPPALQPHDWIGTQNCDNPLAGGGISTPNGAKIIRQKAG